MAQFSPRLRALQHFSEWRTSQQKPVESCEFNNMSNG